MTNDPFKVVDQGAIMLHELFESYISADFTRAEALELIKALLLVGTKNNSEEGKS